MKSGKKPSPGATDWLLLGLALVFFVGILTFFKPCGPKEDGSWMTCHWAGQAVTGVAAAMLILAVCRLLGTARFKTGLDAALIVLSALATALPGHLIGLCMMHDMRCRRIMTPCVLVLSILTILAAAADMLLQNKKEPRHEV